MQKPHGGRLIGRVLTGDRREKLMEDSGELPSFQLNRDQVKDLENLAFGVFSPLDGFMTQDDYLSVLQHMRLADDVAWTLPKHSSSGTASLGVR